MNWRFKRQLIIFLILIAVFLVGSLFFFDFGAKATCFDGKKNGDETGIDCGGSCQLVCPGQSRPLVVRFQRSFRVAYGVYNAVAYVANPNPTQAIFQIPYEFRVYDSKDVLIAERTGKTFVPPNQSIAIFETDIRTGGREVTRTAFRFLQEPQWINVDKKLANLPISVSDEKIVSGPPPSLTATLRNNSLFELRDLSVAVILYDASGNAVAASKTLLSTVPRKKDLPLLFSWNESFSAPPVRIEIIPQIDVFNLSL